MIINKNLIRDYFIFSKRERRGVIALAILIAFIWLLSFFLKAIIPEETWHISQVKNDLLLLRQMQTEYLHLQEKKKTKFPKKEKQIKKNDALAFQSVVDPNSMTFKDWMRLGLNYQETCTVMNYKRKAGGFSEAYDVKKIKNLPEEKINKILPYLKVSHLNTVSETKGTETFNQQNKAETKVNELENFTKRKEKKSPEIFELNSCNARALRQIECLDSLSAQRILKKRKALGGFTTLNQLHEIDSLSENCLDVIKKYAIADTQMIRKIDINRVTIKDLGRHPYIGYNMASALVNFRDKHGKFRNPDDLKKCMIMTKERIEKIKPYLIFGP
jgi:DNA uptake protein ComE-like DNA-binding protein